MLTTPRFAGSVGLADHAAARIDRLFYSRAKLPPLVTRGRAALTMVGLGAVAALVYSSPRLNGRESIQLHAMTVNLIAHHVQARIIGFGITALAVAVVFAGARRLAGRAR